MSFCELAGKIYEQESKTVGVDNEEHIGSDWAIKKYWWYISSEKRYTQKQQSRTLIKIVI